MNNDWLSQLAPEHAPAPVGWWPLAPGWWGVVGFVVLLLAAGVWWWRSSPRIIYRQQRRAALAELRRIRTAPKDVVGVACAIENLLRRYALSVFGAERVAKLSGRVWMGFVVAQGGEEWAGDTGRTLLAAAFGKVDERDLRARWIAAAEAFIRRAPRKASKRGTT